MDRGERSRSRRRAWRVGSGAKKRKDRAATVDRARYLLFRLAWLGVGRGGGRGRDEGESRGFGRTCWGFSPFTFSRVAMFRFLSRVYPELPASLRGVYRSGLASSHARAREVFVANRRGLSAPLLSLNPPPVGVSRATPRECRAKPVVRVVAMRTSSPSVSPRLLQGVRCDQNRGDIPGSSKISIVHRRHEGVFHHPLNVCESPPTEMEIKL